MRSFLTEGRLRYIFILLISCIVTHVSSQSFQHRWLEIYNPNQSDPSNIRTDSCLEMNFTLYETYNKGFLSHIVLPFSDHKGFLAVGYSRCMAASIVFEDIHLDYAYKHTFNEVSSLVAAFRLNYSGIDFQNASYPESRTIRRYVFYTTIGATYSLKGFHIGASIGIPAITGKIAYISEDNKETIKQEGINNLYSFHFGYKLGKDERFSIEPQFSFQSDQYFQSWYIGARTTFKNIFGFGFTAGDVQSFSTSIQIRDRFLFMLGLASNENFMKYSMKFSPLNYIAQIRFTL